MHSRDASDPATVHGAAHLQAPTLCHAFIDIVPNVYVDCAWTAQSTRNAHTLLSHHHLKVVQLP